MQRRKCKNTPVNPRLSASRHLLEVAKSIRQRGTIEEAEEATIWEKKIQERVSELETPAPADKK